MNDVQSTAAGSIRAHAPAITARRVAGVAALAVATAIAARIALPLPGTPVPFTFQPMVVILAGALLGARLGAASQLVYLLAGLAGLPVFVAGGGAAYLLGPTGGYLLAFPLAAFVVGALSADGVGRNAVALLAGIATIYLGGVAWLAAWGSLTGAVAMGVVPFLVADAVKVLMVLVIVHRFRRPAMEFLGR